MIKVIVHEINKHYIFKWLYIIIIIIPIFFELALINGIQVPFGFIILIAFSLYYIPIASIFGKSIFLTETVVMPYGLAGILVAAATYSIPFILWWFFVIKVKK
jgi:hypothetical protein